MSSEATSLLVVKKYPNELELWSRSIRLSLRRPDFSLTNTHRRFRREGPYGPCICVGVVEGHVGVEASENVNWNTDYRRRNSCEMD